MRLFKPKGGIMKTYETVFIVDPDVTQEQATATFEKFKGLITENGGEIINEEVWGRLRLAYEINRKKEGYYFLIQFNADPNFPIELERRFKFDESVIRYIVINIDGKKFKLKKRSDMTQKVQRRGRGFKKDYGRQSEKAEETTTEETDETVNEDLAEPAESTETDDKESSKSSEE